MKAVAKASAERAIADPALLDRALDRYVREIYRDQENREAVAKKAIEHLATGERVDSSGNGPSDDWMNVFERHAERASSEQIRDLWGRVLAGEIRQPGSFSLRTLQFISLIDAAGALLIDRLLPFVFDSSM